MQTAGAHTYQVTKSASKKIENIAHKSFPPQTYRNADPTKFTRNAYPQRTCPKKIAQICNTHLVMKKTQNKTSQSS